jgi:hypothetical protein
MRLLKRRSQGEDAVECPECGERMPTGALECAMVRTRTRRARAVAVHPRRRNMENPPERENR